MTADDAIAALKARGEPDRADQMAAYHKVERPYLGVASPETDTLVRSWRQSLSLDERLTLARDLWNTDIFEARVAAAKLLTQARIRPADDAVWELIQSWVPEFDSWAIADHACMAGQRRLIADPTRLDTVETWITNDHMWTRRAALVITLPGMSIYRLTRNGVMIGGYNLVREQNGVLLGLLGNRTETGTGLQIGALFNNAKIFHGLQIGLINHIGNNPFLFRWMPVINFHFGGEEE